jgi:DNA-binding ferritin-like protein (Dps family)
MMKIQQKLVCALLALCSMSFAHAQSGTEQQVSDQVDLQQIGAFDNGSVNNIVGFVVADFVNDLTLDVMQEQMQSAINDAVEQAANDAAFLD